MLKKIFTTISFIFLASQADSCLAQTTAVQYVPGYYIASGDSEGGVNCIVGPCFVPYGPGATCLASGCTFTGPVIFADGSEWTDTGPALSAPLSPANGGTGVNSLGTGVSAFLQTPSSGNLYSALTSKTGTGGTVVFNVAPTLTTPNIGAASGTSIKLSQGITLGTAITVGSSSNYTESAGDIAQTVNSSDPGTAPGANGCKLLWIPGTVSGHQLIARCGTSTTAVTIIDNVEN